MIGAHTFKGRRVAVFGLGRSGAATVRALLAGGATVDAWDDGEAARAAAAADGMTLTDLTTAPWTDYAALVLAPGVPLTHPAPHWTVACARAAGVEIFGDTEIFFRERRARCPGSPVVAITGTNGKSTTTALVAHTLEALGCRVAMGGNIGTAVLSLEEPAADLVHVLELSSFQIDLTPTLDPTVGVMLNLTPDHLDRHGTMEVYAAVKEQLVRKASVACVGLDDDWSRGMAARRPGGAVTFSVDRLADFEARDRELRYDHRPFGSLAGIDTLRGVHNAQNALAAAAAIYALRRVGDRDVWRPDEIVSAFATYPGLPHRMEIVGRRDRVLFVNDSKATNADSTEKALAAFPGGIHWILGGKPKEGGIRRLATSFPRIERAYLIGAAAEEFAATLSGNVPFEHCGTLEVAAVRAAAAAAASTAVEPVVLLSPACASYDQFRSFEHRGDSFRDWVRAYIAAEGR